MAAYSGTIATDQDLVLVSWQLGRDVRDVDSIAARSVDGEPLVVATLPRLSDGSPFPTAFYLTHPGIRAAISRLEATGVMERMNLQLRQSAKLQRQYLQAHEAYLEVRSGIARRHGIPEVPEIAGISAGGMPKRIKCLHALAAQSLALGTGSNVFGDEALLLVRQMSEGAVGVQR